MGNAEEGVHREVGIQEGGVLKGVQGGEWVSSGGTTGHGR